MGNPALHKGTKALESFEPLRWIPVKTKEVGGIRAFSKEPRDGGQPLGLGHLGVEQRHPRFHLRLGGRGMEMGGGYGVDVFFFWGVRRFILLYRFVINKEHVESFDVRVCCVLLLRGEVLFFPTCQVRVVRFYHSCSSSSASASAASSPSSFLLPPCFLPRQSASPIVSGQLRIAVCTPGPQPQGSPRSVHPWTSTARIRSQCASLDLNCKDPIAVCTPGPQPQGSDRSVHRWTSTARIRSQCALLDLNRKDPIAVCTAGPQPDSLPDKIHKHTISNTRPQTRNHKHTPTNTITNSQSQTHNYKHNYKDTITNT